MTAVQEIQAAIEKLTAVKVGLGDVALSSDGELFACCDDDTDENGNGFVSGLNLQGVDSDWEINDAIVTLHRTIDAQLGILRFVTRNVSSYPEDHLVELYAEELALARAINGVTP